MISGHIHQFHTHWTAGKWGERVTGGSALALVGLSFSGLARAQPCMPDELFPPSAGHHRRAALAAPGSKERCPAKQDQRLTDEMSITP